MCIKSKGTLELSEDDANDDVEDRRGRSDNTVGPEDSSTNEPFESVAGGCLCDLEKRMILRSVHINTDQVRKQTYLSECKCRRR